MSIELSGISKTLWRLVIIIILIAVLYFINQRYLHFDFFPTKDLSTIGENSNSNSNLNSNLDSLNFIYKVAKVVDGDTLDIERLDGEKMENGEDKTRIRLIGVNTPELVALERPAECFGKEASQYTKLLVAGQEVALETDDTQSLFDKYGRQLAYVYLKAPGKDANYFMLNQRLIADGYAYEYTYDYPYQYHALLKESEIEAKDKNLGLWNPNTCSGLKTPV